MDSTNTTTNCDRGKKRPVKGLRRAYWDCKRRKVQKDSSKTDISSHCSINGLESERVDQNNACSLHIGDRLKKLEKFFEKFEYIKSPAAQSTSDIPLSPSFEDPSGKQSKHGLHENPKDTRSKLSLDDDVTCSAQTWISAPSIHALDEKQEEQEKQEKQEKQGDAHTSTEDTIARKLVALLPSQHDADIIFESSYGWSILDSVYTASRDIYANRDVQSYALDMASVARTSSMIIGRTLLHLAVCINSLPSQSILVLRRE